VDNLDKTDRTRRVEVRDQPPASYQLDRATPVFQARLGPAESEVLSYRACPARRGYAAFGELYRRTEGPLRLMKRAFTQHDSAQPVRVYPNLRELRRYDLVVRRGREAQAAGRPVRVPGASIEFERVREYLPADEFRRINWKAAARRGQPLVNQFEAERSQNVVLLLDAGRTTAALADPPAEEPESAANAIRADSAANTRHADSAANTRHADSPANARHADFDANMRRADFDANVRRADFAANASRADFAANASRAESAENARHADSAANARHADFDANVRRADFAANASRADFAANASRAESAENARHADSAATARHADSPANARHADFDANVRRADFGMNASRADSAANARNADFVATASSPALTKLDRAVNAALLLAHVASQRGDRVALLAYADDVRVFVPRNVAAARCLPL
jgi:Protein of unknown function DUF58